MYSDKIRTWVYCFLSSQRIKKIKNNKIDIACIKQSYLNLKLGRKSNNLIENIIFYIVSEIGKECRKYQMFFINNIVNQHNILKSFIYSRILENSIWIFKFRKNFSKYRLKKKSL